MKKVIFLFFTLIPLQIFAQISDSELLRAIRHDDVSTISSYFKNTNNDPNRLYDKTKVPLMHYAASINKISTIKILIEAGADINKLYQNDSPLMVAIYFDQKNTVEFLLKNNVDINLKDSSGRTAVIKAALDNRLEYIKLLNQHNVDLTIHDKSGKSAVDYAYELQNVESYNYLCVVTDCKYDKMVLPNYFDGPYVFWLGKSKYMASYIISDSLHNKTYRIDSIIKIDKKENILKNKEQLFDIPIRKIGKKDAELCEYYNVEKIMAIGDIHGEFETLYKFLINNKIIDKNYNWIFGKGHLVLEGDMFDRGNMVNECFWLLYKLEAEADAHGGKVHFILGNHELMQISGDKRYLNEKYLQLFNRLRLNYTEFYGDNTELGRWLRNKNSVLKINDLLFVHGGLSKSLVDSALSVKSINNIVRAIIGRKHIEPRTAQEEFIMGIEGPLWYRGYIKLDDSYYANTGLKYNISEKAIDGILKFYHAKAIIFANTHVKQISPMFNFKLFGIDIPFAETEAELQGLYIVGEHFYRALFNGKKKILY